MSLSGSAQRTAMVWLKLGFTVRTPACCRDELRLEDRRAIGSVRLERVGTKSVTARAELRAPDGRMAAEAELVIVSRDPVTGTSRPLSEPERAAFEGARDE